MYTIIVYRTRIELCGNPRQNDGEMTTTSENRGEYCFTLLILVHKTCVILTYIVFSVQRGLLKTETNRYFGIGFLLQLSGLNVNSGRFFIACREDNSPTSFQGDVVVCWPKLLRCFNMKLLLDRGEENIK